MTNYNLILIPVGLSLMLSITESIIATFICKIIYKFSFKKIISIVDVSDKFIEKVRLTKKKKYKDYFGAYKIIPETKEILFRTNFINNRFFHMSLGRLIITGNKGNYKLKFYVHFLSSPVIYIFSLFIWYAFYKFSGLGKTSFCAGILAFLVSLILTILCINREKTSLNFLYLIIKNEFEK